MLLAAVAALLWGTGDFLGGTAGRRGSPVIATWVSSASGLVCVAALLPFVSGHLNGKAALVGASAGVFGSLGLLAFYSGLATGRMVIVAPVSALTTAVVPLVVGLATGDRLHALGVVGLVLGLVGLGLAAAEGGEVLDESEPSHGETEMGAPADDSRLKSLLLALGAGVGFGTFTALIGKAGDNVGLWALLVSRCASLVVLTTLVVVTVRLGRAKLSVANGLGRIAMGSGVMDAGANAVYLAAVAAGSLAVVGPVGSMYPASTVLLAMAVHKERPHARQVLGMCLMLLGVLALASPSA